MKLAIGILFVALIAAGVFLRVQAEKIASLEGEVQSLNARVSEEPKSASLDLQEKCAVQARKIYVELGWDKKTFASYESHYGRRMNRCFIRINSLDGTANSSMVFDAFEQKEYGEYMWFGKEGKKYWEVAPVECAVTLPSGEKKVCKSRDEFDELVKAYMEAW